MSQQQRFGSLTGPNDGILGNQLTRRTLIRRAGAIGLSASAIATLLAACGGEESGGTTGNNVATAGTTRPATGASATPSSSSGDEASGKTLDVFTLAQDIDPETLNPTKVARTQSRNVYATIFDALMHRNAQMEVEPKLAEKWEWVDDTTLRFHLRSGVTFHDGSELTAEDVKYTFEQASLPSSAHAGNLQRISSVEAIEPLTVEIKVSEPDPLLLTRIVDSIYIIPAKYHQEVGDEGFEQKPIGSGPYKFVEWVKGNQVTVEANDDYWGGAPSIRTVVIKSIPEPTTRVSTVQSGGADLGIYVPVQLIPSIEQDSTVQLLVGPSPTALYIGMAVRNPILADKRVRQAINHAVDTNAIRDRLGGGEAKLLYGMILPEMIGYDQDMAPYPYDPERAKALLAEAGYPDGFEVVFDIPDGRVPSPNDTASIVASYLLEVGIKANIQVHAFDEFSDYLYQRNGKVLEGLWYFHGKSSTLDPDDLLNASFHTGGRWNWGGYNNPELDALLDSAYRETDEDKRADLYRQICQVVQEEAYYVPLYQLIAYYVAKKSDRWNWEPRPDEMIFIADDVKLA